MGKKKLAASKAVYTEALEKARALVMSGKMCCMSHAMKMSAECLDLELALSMADKEHTLGTFGNDTLGHMFEQAALVINGIVASSKLTEALVENMPKREAQDDENSADGAGLVGKMLVDLMENLTGAKVPPFPGMQKPKKHDHDA